MKKDMKMMCAALLLCCGFAVSCGSDDDPQPNHSGEPSQATLAGTYGGWTWGSNDHAAYIPSEGDTLFISQTTDNATSCTLTYTSPTWGTTTLANVTVTKNDTAYVFAKPITAVLREDHSAWDFSAAVDSIAMPNRNPQAGTVTIKNYPIVLTGGTMSLDCKNWQIDFDAYLVPRSAHIQHISFRNGHIQQPQ